MLHRGSNCSLARAMDGRIMCCGIISSCQSAATSEIAKRSWARVHRGAALYQVPDLYVKLHNFKQHWQTDVTLTLLIVCRSAINSTHSVRCWRMHSAALVDTRLCEYGLYWYDTKSATMLTGPSVPPASTQTSCTHIHAHKHTNCLPKV